MIEISNTIISPIGTILSNRDRVEIIKGDGNKDEWPKVVPKTVRAKIKIRSLSNRQFA